MDLLSRFYVVMEHFNDDDRIAAHAITIFAKDQTPTCNIYKDLLAVKVRHWTPILEKIIKTNDLTEWINETTFKLDMMRDNFWSCGDSMAIQKGVWIFQANEEMEE